MSFPAVIKLDKLDGTNGFVVNGLDADDHLGIYPSRTSFPESDAGIFVPKRRLNRRQ